VKIAATKTYCIQTGEDTFANYHDTRVFDTSTTLDDIIKWFMERTLRGQQKVFFHISEIQFSMVDEEE
jgi:hypothetical protein